MELTAYTTGFSIGLTLILAIGAQNAFVLRQGLRGEHVFAVCLACAVSDAILVVLGVSGFSAMTRHVPMLEPVMRYGGAAFLAIYGARAMLSALRGGDALLVSEIAGATLSATLAATLAFTWLNPHVYLDTVVLLGSISTQFSGHEPAFAAGAITASFVFFFTLGYGAQLLRPIFARPLAWRVLDALIALTMWMIAIRLL